MFVRLVGFRVLSKMLPQNPNPVGIGDKDQTARIVAAHGGDARELACNLRVLRVGIIHNSDGLLRRSCRCLRRLGRSVTDGERGRSRDEGKLRVARGSGSDLAENGGLVRLGHVDQA